MGRSSIRSSIGASVWLDLTVLARSSDLENNCLKWRPQNGSGEIP